MEAHCSPPAPFNAGVTAGYCGFILLGVAITAPQYLKIVRSRSSAGLSLATIVLTTVLTLSDAAAAVITKWRQIEACSAGWGCVSDLVDLAQVVILTLSTGVAMLLLVVCYPPHDTRRHRAIAAVSCAIVAAAWTASVLVSLDGPCGARALSVASAFGMVAAACAVVQYLPQLYVTMRNRTSGSLSVAFYLLQVVGGLVMLAEQLQRRDQWQVWLPFLASTSMQLLVACCCIWFDGLRWLRGWRQGRRREAVDGTNAARLLDQAHLSSDHPAAPQ
jgi:uncharacterized protein with PQ loop repeat